MKNRQNIIFSLYLTCISLYVLLSADFLDKIKLLVPLTASLCLFFFIIASDSKGLIKLVRKSWLLCLFVFLTSVGLLRSNLPDKFFLYTFYKVATVYVFYFNSIYVLNFLVQNNDIRKIMKLLIVPFFIFGIINLLLYLIGLGEASDIPSILAQLFGMPDVNRVRFFLVSGINSYGVINGLFLAVSLICFYFKIFNRIHSLLYILVFFLVAVLTDSRGAIIFSVVSIAISWIIEKRRSFLFLKLLPFIMVLAPVLLVILLPQLATSGFFTNISRGDNDIASGNTRFIIWGIIGLDFFNGSGLTFLGLGEGGIYKISSIMSLTILFEGLEDSTGKVLIHPHSSLIAMILDYGVLTLIVFISVLVTSIKGLIKSVTYNPKLFILASIMLIYLVLIGSTESFIGFYYPNVMITYLFVLCLLSSLMNLKIDKE